MTFLTRQTAAYRHSSSIVHRLERQRPRSTSRARSAPILRRWFQQPATVLGRAVDADIHAIDCEQRALRVAYVSERAAVSPGPLRLRLALQQVPGREIE